MDGLYKFIEESNRIERIFRVKPKEIEAHEILLTRTSISVPNVIEFVHTICQAPLRSKFGLNVYIGEHTPICGGSDVVDTLYDLLDSINNNQISPYEGHIAYETLHPFMDGNGRSGRAIWAWHMRLCKENPFKLGFLHEFYYQSLQASRKV